MKKQCSLVTQPTNETFLTMEEEILYKITGSGAYRGHIVYKPAGCGVVIDLSERSGWADPLPCFHVERLPVGTKVILTQTGE